MADMIQLNVRIDPALLEQTQVAAEAGDLNLSQWVRRAIREKLDRDASGT